jgi:hypothetical protein
MGYYSTLVSQPRIKTHLTEEQFFKKWDELKASLIGTVDEGFLDQYDWKTDKKEGSFTWYYLELEDWHSKHYADEALAEFISEVIAEGERCLLEFNGEDGCNWGYYITKGSVKEIEYVKMVDGKRIE